MPAARAAQPNSLGGIGETMENLNTGLLSAKGYWFLLMVISGVLGIWAFKLNKDITLKRKLLPVFYFGSAIIFAAFVGGMTRNFKTALFVFPIALVVQFINFRLTTVCDSCGAIIFRGHYRLFKKPENCPKCKTPLTWS